MARILRDHVGTKMKFLAPSFSLAWSLLPDPLKAEWAFGTTFNMMLRIL